MMTNEFAGARWWRVDLHTHTPASHDYGKGERQERHREITPRDWLLDFMRAEIDCVVVTDHNTGGWVAKLQASHRELEAERPETLRPLVVFPGAEVTVHGGYHLLAILDREKSRDDVVALLGALDIQSAKQGSPEAISSLTITQAAEKINEYGGLAIPAHVDGRAGIFLNDGDGGTALKGQSLIELLQSDYVHAVEVRDPGFDMPGAYVASRARWAQVVGSDSHHPADAGMEPAPGGRYTWVKMGEPSLEGLRLALLDRAPLSILRSDEVEDDPNRHARLYIEGLEIDNGQYTGRDEPLTAGFSPWLSAIIGGRGTGKSTLIEMMRLVLRRQEDLPARLKEELSHFRRIPASRRDHGALTSETELRMTLTKEGETFRLRWRQDGTEGPEIEHWDENAWQPSPGEVAERFKVRLLSQKQVFAMAGDAGSLLRLIDESPQVGRREWERRHAEASARFLGLRSRARALATKLDDRQRLEGELADAQRQLAVFEEGGHRELLVQYRRLVRQRRTLDDRSDEFAEAVEAARRVSESTGPSDPIEEHFAMGHPAEAEGLKLLREAVAKQRELGSWIGWLAELASTRLSEWKDAVGSSAWSELEQETHSSYNALVERLKADGPLDPSMYGDLVHRRQEIEGQIADLAVAEEEFRRTGRDAEQALEDVEQLRKELSERRGRFLVEVLSDNDFVRIDVLPFGEDPRAAEPGFRRAIGRQDERLRNDILDEERARGIVADLYRDLPEAAAARQEALVARVTRLKRDVLSVRESGHNEQWSKWFSNHVQELSPEQVDRFELWWPEDELRVEYRRTGEAHFTPIAQGSPGQKSAAMLAFLLSHGTEPIILDQPEDDLDNRLISDLVVEQVRRSKRSRQVIVATHNPNIVVNGDAEMIVSMVHRGGQCCVLEEGSGCLQESGVRSEICEVMEGGQEAFESRYRRLHKGDRDE